MIPLVLTALGLAAASDGGGGDGDERRDPRDLQLEFMKKRWPKLFAAHPHTVLWTRMDNAPLEAEMMWLLGEWPDPRSVVVVFEGNKKFSVKDGSENEWAVRSEGHPDKRVIAPDEDGAIWEITYTDGIDEMVSDRLRAAVESMGIVFAEMDPGTASYADVDRQHGGMQFRGASTKGEWVEASSFAQNSALMYGLFLDMGYSLALVFDDFGFHRFSGFRPYVIHPLPSDDPHQMHKAKSRDKLARKIKYMWPRQEEKVSS